MPRRTDDVMNLRALKCFLVTAQCGSLTKAGVDLNLCEAAVSERVRSLETWLGVKLYEKHGGGVQLTAAGERTVQAAVTLFREIEALEEALRVPPYIVKGQTTRTHVLLTLGEPDLRAQDGAWSGGAVACTGQYLPPSVTREPNVSAIGTRKRV